MHKITPNGRNSSGYIFVLTSILFVVASGIGYAQEQRLMTLKDLTVKADNVVIADCTNVQSFWNTSRTMIFTEIKHKAIAEDFILKGSLSSGMHSFVRPGGQVGNIKTIVSHQPPYTVGDRSLLFLYHPKRISFFGTVGASIGKIPIHRDPKTRKEFVVLWILPWDKSSYFTVAPSVEAKPLILSLAQLQDLIKSWIRESENKEEQS